MPNGGFFDDDWNNDDEFGDYSYLTHMARYASTGAPQQVFQTMAATKSGDFKQAVNEHVETLGGNGATAPQMPPEIGGLDTDPLAEYEDPEDPEDPYAEEDWWTYDEFFIPEEGSALQDSFDAMEAGDMEQGLGDVDDIVSSAIPLTQGDYVRPYFGPGDMDIPTLPLPTYPMFDPPFPIPETMDLPMAPEPPLGPLAVPGPISQDPIGSGQALAIGPSLVDPMSAAGSTIWEAGQKALASAGGAVESTFADFPHIPKYNPSIAYGFDPTTAMDKPMTPEEIAAAIEGGEGQRQEYRGDPPVTAFGILNGAFDSPDPLGYVQKVISEGVLESDVQDWMDSPGWGGTESLRNDIIEAGLLPKTKALEETTKKTDQLQQDDSYWYERRLPDGTVLNQRYMTVREAEGYPDWYLSEEQGTPPAKQETNILDEVMGEGGITGADLLEASLPPGADEYKVAEENLRAVFYPTIYQQQGVEQATRGELETLLNQTRILFFLESGKKAWEDLGGYKYERETYEEADYSPEDRPTLEKNYEEWLGGYLDRPFAQRINQTEGPDFYNLVKDVSLFLNSPYEDPSQLEPEEMDRWWGKEDRRVWVEGLFGGDEKQNVRDELVKMGLTHGGMGDWSQMIHRAAQNQMDHYRNIGWSEARIFDHMTKGMNKPQEAQRLPASEYPEGYVRPYFGPKTPPVIPQAQPTSEYPEGYVRPYFGPK
jgi:hypothetical protein